MDFHKYSLDKNPSMRKKVFFLLIFMVFAKILVLNIYTPLLMDDINYSFSTSVLDALQREYNRYMNYNGRSISNFLVRVFLLWPKGIFNIANSLVYTCLTLLIYKIANPKKTYHISLYLFIVFAIWLYTITFGQVILWLTGSITYSWTAAIILSFLLPYSLYVSDKPVFKNKYIPIAGMLLLGVIAGWCNENTSGGMILIVFLLLIYCRVFKYKIKIWMISGLIGSIIGFLIMILAPGMYKRAQYEGFADDRTLLEIMVTRSEVYTSSLQTDYAVLVIIFIILITMQIYLQKDPKRTCISLIFFIASIATIYALMFSPKVAATRPMIGPTVFMIIACASCFAGLSFSKTSLRIASISFICILAFQFGTTYLLALGDIGRTSVVANRRVEFIEVQKAQGNLNVLIPHWHMPHIHARTPWNPFYESPDFGKHSHVGYNTRYARYYGLKSIWWENLD